MATLKREVFANGYDSVEKLTLLFSSNYQRPVKSKRNAEIVYDLVVKAKTREELATKHKVSRSRISQIMTSAWAALRRLRHD